MEVALNILAKLLIEHGAQVTISGGEGLEQLLRERCCQALKEIRDVLDDGTLVGKMAPGMNAELGQMQILSERGN